MAIPSEINFLSRISDKSAETILSHRHTHGKGRAKITNANAAASLSNSTPNSFPTRNSTLMLQELVLPPFDKWQIFIFAVLVFTFSWHVVIIIWPMWAKSNDVTSPPVMVEYMYRGIWVQCSTHTAGIFSCDNFMRPIFSLSSLAIVQRCFAVMSLACCSATLILMIIGMECTKFYLKNPAKKVFLMKIAALVLFIGSFLLLLTASIYAASLSQQFNNSMFYSSALGSLFGGKSNYDADLIRYELGACLYIGWIICFFEFVLAIAIYFNRGFQYARDDPFSPEKTDENNYSKLVKRLEEYDQLMQAADYDVNVVRSTIRKSQRQAAPGTMKQNRLFSAYYG